MSSNCYYCGGHPDEVSDLRRRRDELEAEVERLYQRLGPRGLEVVEIDGTGHYVNEKVKAEIERLRSENEHFRAATLAAMQRS